jgi:hypothetical protein
MVGKNVILNAVLRTKTLGPQLDSNRKGGEPYAAITRNDLSEEWCDLSDSQYSCTRRNTIYALQNLLVYAILANLQLLPLISF